MKFQYITSRIDNKEKGNFVALNIYCIVIELLLLFKCII